MKNDLRERKIDVHHHILPHFYVDALEEMGVEEAGGRAFPPWTPQDSISLMDKYGIKAAVTSISAPGIYFGDPKKARVLARRCNEYSANLKRDYPGRFGALAVLPLPDVEGSLREVEFSLDSLRLDGVILLTSAGERYLGDSDFDELFAELDRRDAVVFIHPHMPPKVKRPRHVLPGSLLEFVFETTLAVSNLLFSGTLERCPHIRFLLPHAGGTLPYVTLRLCLGQFWPGLQENIPQGVIAYLKRMYYDTALSSSPFALRSLQELVEDTQILFATDYPFAPELATMATIGGLESYDGFEEDSLERVFYRNAALLFPRVL